jgi:DnaK suppressor protein
MMSSPAVKGAKRVSEVNVSEFRRLLEAKYDELSSIASNRDEIIIEAAADEMDRLQQQLGRDMAIRNLDRTSTLLKSIRAALDRIEDEIYGVCLRCEEPIAEKRLKAIPWASYCVGCQETIDRHHALREGDSDTIAFAA